MYFSQLENEARQRLIDVKQRGEALRAVRTDLERRFAGSMACKPRDGRDYLDRHTGRVEKALGPRSAATEATSAAFVAGKAAALQRAEGLKRTLEDMARVNHAMGLGRVLGEQVCVVGTNALFAYEAHAGIRLATDLLATVYIDIALDPRRSLLLAAKSMPDGLLGLLRKVDASFAPQAEGSFRAVNAGGLMVDLIKPEPRDRMTVAPRRQRRLGDAGAASVEAMHAVDIPRQMIADAPRFAATAVAEDGLPVWIAAADPHWWAAHKLWLASEPTRDPLKRQRDGDQGRAVATMLAQAWEPAALSDQALASIPVALRHVLRDAVASGAEDDSNPEW